MSTSQLGEGCSVWQADGHALRIEYSKAVAGEIRAAALEGLRRLSHGGLEIGGVLYGEREGDAVRVREWKPIACCHARGPSFLLSVEDEAGLSGLLKEAGPEGLVPVGWFHTHTRSGILLTESDLALYQRFFPEVWQVALVVRPERDGTVYAGIFFREDGGYVHAGSSYRNFEMEAVAPRMRAPAAAPPPVVPPRRLPEHREPEPEAESEPVVEPPQFLTTQPIGRPRVWWNLLLIFTCLLAGLAGAYLYARLLRPPDALVALELHDAGGQLRISWTRAARAVQEADRGRLLIADGAATPEIALDQAALRTGAVVYARRSEQVKVRLVLETKGSRVAEEIAQFVGQAPAGGAEELDALRAERDRLAAENKRLDGDFKREGGRADRFRQQYYQLLQDRLREEQKRSGAR